MTPFGLGLCAIFFMTLTIVLGLDGFLPASIALGGFTASLIIYLSTLEMDGDWSIWSDHA